MKFLAIAAVIFAVADLVIKFGLGGAALAACLLGVVASAARLIFHSDRLF